MEQRITIVKDTNEYGTMELYKIISDSNVIGQGSRYVVLGITSNGNCGLHYPRTEEGLLEAIKAYTKYTEKLLKKETLK